jgi:hypothetical protein
MIYIGDDIEILISETPLHRFQNIYFDLTQVELTIAQRMVFCVVQSYVKVNFRFSTKYDANL